MLYPSKDLELAPMMEVHDDDNEVRVTTRGNEKVVGLGSGGGGGRSTLSLTWCCGRWQIQSGADGGVDDGDKKGAVENDTVKRELSKRVTGMRRERQEREGPWRFLCVGETGFPMSVIG